MKKMIRNVLEKTLGFSTFHRLIEKKNELIRHPETVKKQAALKGMVGMYSSMIRPGDLVFDVGANMGNRIEAFLKIGAKPVAVEPQEKCCEFLRSKYGKSISLVPKGCSEREEEKEFFVSDSSTISSFSEDWVNKMKSGRFSEHTWEKKEKIRMTTLDKLIGKFGVPQFIKIDVEGFEPQVLKGLSQKVRYLSFEYAEPEQHANTLECIDILMRINPFVEFNYSVGETMRLEREGWISGSEMKKFVESKEFMQSGFGDVYARN